jgi:hypothetical protein
MNLQAVFVAVNTSAILGLIAPSFLARFRLALIAR